MCSDLTTLYQKRANLYDYTSNLYYFIGFRMFAYRKKAIKSLKLKKGDTVVEIACGTGLNFPFLVDYVGEEGKIIGVDISKPMLKKAKKRIERNEWKNVELIQNEASNFNFPTKVDGILATFSITLIPEFDKLTKNASKALAKEKRMVIMDLKIPDNYLKYFSLLGIMLSKPFGVSKKELLKKPWESIQRYLNNMSMKEYYMGIAYIAFGIKK